MDTVSFYGHVLLTASLHSRTNSKFSMQLNILPDLVTRAASKSLNKIRKVAEPSYLAIN